MIKPLEAALRELHNRDAYLINADALTAAERVKARDSGRYYSDNDSKGGPAFVAIYSDAMPQFVSCHGALNQKQIVYLNGHGVDNSTLAIYQSIHYCNQSCHHVSSLLEAMPKQSTYNRHEQDSDAPMHEWDSTTPTIQVLDT